MDKKTERVIGELDWRAELWERKKANAEKEIEKGMRVPLAKIDLDVAEKALERIEKKKHELLGLDNPKVEYIFTHLYTEPVEAPVVEEPKKVKRVHKQPGAVFALAVKDKGDKKDE